jgi:hypothetical protein
MLLLTSGTGRPDDPVTGEDRSVRSMATRWAAAWMHPARNPKQSCFDRGRRKHVVVRDETINPFMVLGLWR